MAKIIETNISYEAKPFSTQFIHDFQSRVIEVESWDIYIDEHIDTKSITRDCIIGNLYGASIPRVATIDDLEHNENTLKCEIYDYRGLRTTRLAYLINEKEE